MPALRVNEASVLPRDKLNERQAWRDRRLMALVAHKRDASNKIRK